MTVGKWIGVFALLIALYILWRIRQVLLLLFVAVVLAMVLNRLVQSLQKFGIRRKVAVALAAIGFLILSTAFVWIVIVPFTEQLQKFVVLLPDLLEEAQVWLNHLEEQTAGEWWAEDIQLLDMLSQQVQPLLSQLVDQLVGWISDLLAIVLKLVLILVLTVMLLSNPQRYRQPFLRLFPAFYRRRADEILTQCEVDLVGWITGTLITMVFVSTASGLGLRILNMPLGLASALWAGFTELIPNIGYVVGMLPPLAIALLDAPWKALPIIGLYFFIQQIESYVIIPWVMKVKVSLPPAVTLLAQVIFATFFGFLGLFLALPLMVITKIWLREVLIKDVLDQWREPGSLL